MFRGSGKSRKAEDLRRKRRCRDQKEEALR
jgi:hypothetical protein